MSKMRLVASVLLALPLIIFGSNYFLDFLAFSEQEAAQAGLDFLQSMRDGGLMGPVAASHVLVGVMLLVPRTRFFAALMQLPICLGIVAFHATMMPEGLGVALFLLVTNVLTLADKDRLQQLID